jgi:hypothetical protein
MRKTATLFLCSVLILAFSGLGHAQMWPQEDHFKVYNLAQPITYTGQIGLVDQFGEVVITSAVLEKFATPAIKNSEEWYDLRRHQTWWRIDQPMPIWKFDVENQFGLGTWYSYNASWLVLPALKNEAGTPLPITNHYKCYDAVGPPLTLQVELADQFDTLTVVVGEPVVFCNPVEKVDAAGIVYPIVDPTAHLACYRINPQYYGIVVTALDQFGLWQVEITDQDWLCVPSYKLNPNATERNTWGRIKQRYTD